MDTIQLQQWRTEFNEIMSGSMPEQLQLDQLRDLHSRTSEQQNMLGETAETETDRML
jgi:response regulator of citrate/malate metabolism